MQCDVVIVGAGPAGIFTALELVRKGAPQKIVLVEKGRPVEKRQLQTLLPYYYWFFWCRCLF